MTYAAYRQRLKLLGTVATWHESNPYRLGAIRRLESGNWPSVLGGLCAPVRTAEDRTVMASEPAVELMRDYPSAATEPLQEF